MKNTPKLPNPLVSLHLSKEWCSLIRAEQQWQSQEWKTPVKNDNFVIAPDDVMNGPPMAVPVPLIVP